MARYDILYSFCAKLRVYFLVSRTRCRIFISFVRSFLIRVDYSIVIVPNPVQYLTTPMSPGEHGRKTDGKKNVCSLPSCIFIRSGVCDNAVIRSNGGTYCDIRRAECVSPARLVCRAMINCVRDCTRKSIGENIFRSSLICRIKWR